MSMSGDIQREAAAIPFCQGYDEATGKLTLRGATHVPDEVYAFAQNHRVEILDASDGTIHALPDDFGTRMGSNLKVAFFSNNRFTAVPRGLRSCSSLEMLALKSCGITEFGENALPPTLRWLMLTDNKIAALPDSIGDLSELQKVALAGNQLHDLPESMQRCKKIGLLRLSANAFTSPPPAWVMQMPALTWYSDAGNPFCAKHAIACDEIAYDALTHGEKLGGSPSSDVYAATESGNARPLAIKIFKGAVTSDGWPEDDMRASLAAGTHPNVMEILGRLTGIPDGKQGIVMKRMEADATSLGKPPTIRSVLRDSFPSGTSFTPAAAERVLSGVAAGMAHLHARNIAHGDLYAHNIMVDSHFKATVGDFGAATIYPPEQKQIREALDMRAFGFLIDDLLAQVPKTNVANEKITKLEKLRDRCLDDDITKRPTFTMIEQEMKPCHARAQPSDRTPG